MTFSSISKSLDGWIINYQKKNILKEGGEDLGEVEDIALASHSLEEFQGQSASKKILFSLEILYTFFSIVIHIFTAAFIILFSIIINHFITSQEENYQTFFNSSNIYILSFLFFFIYMVTYYFVYRTRNRLIRINYLFGVKVNYNYLFMKSIVRSFQESCSISTIFLGFLFIFLGFFYSLVSSFVGREALLLGFFLFFMLGYFTYLFFLDSSDKREKYKSSVLKREKYTFIGKEVWESL